MRVRVRFFARLRETAGAAECEVQIPPDGTVRDAWQAAVVRYPSLEPFGGSVSCAVNADFAKPAATVREGDEVAFLPPVSGGSRSVEP